MKQKGQKQILTYDWFLTKCAKTIQWAKQFFQQMILGKLGIHMQKDEVETLPNTTYKN
jgi:hypothetical protein